jgi:hypothetical protein
MCAMPCHGLLHASMSACTFSMNQPAACWHPFTLFVAWNGSIPS